MIVLKKSPRLIHSGRKAAPTFETVLTAEMFLLHILKAVSAPHPRTTPSSLLPIDGMSQDPEGVLQTHDPPVYVTPRCGRKARTAARITDPTMSRLYHWAIAGQNYPEIIERRGRNYAHLLSGLGDISAPVFDGLPPGVCPLFYPLRTRNKHAILQRLFERKVEAVNFWSTVPKAVPTRAFPEVERLRETILELPCHQDVTPEMTEWIVQQVREMRYDL